MAERAAIVTGASSGIGLAIAERLATGLDRGLEPAEVAGVERVVVGGVEGAPEGGIHGRPW